jgi:hypothetical protein
MRVTAGMIEYGSDAVRTNRRPPYPSSGEAGAYIVIAGCRTMCSSSTSATTPTMPRGVGGSTDRPRRYAGSALRHWETSAARGAGVGTAGGSPSHFRVPAENHAPAGDSFHAASPKRPEARRARASSSSRDFSAQRVQRDRKRSADADRFGASALLIVARDAGLSLARRSATVVPANGGVTLMAGTPRNQREP